MKTIFLTGRDGFFRLFFRESAGLRAGFAQKPPFPLKAEVFFVDRVFVMKCEESDKNHACFIS